MPTVRLQISATAAHVRTARLVATAVARRSGVADSALDEIRLAVGEACSRAVSLHDEFAPRELITLLLEDEGKFVVTVRDCGPVGAGSRYPDPLEAFEGLVAPQGALAASGERIPASFGLAVIGGLVDDVEVRPARDGTGTVVRMTWPLGPPADLIGLGR
jgi:anti-sigma regulatory factor (Ser/Thr protein kinase)